MHNRPTLHLNPTAGNKPNIPRRSYLTNVLPNCRLPMRYLFIALFFVFITPLMSQDYTPLRDKIDAAIKVGKPKTALEAAEEYYQMAAKANDEDEMLKALGYRAGLVQQLEQDGSDAALQLLHKELVTSANRPVVSAVLNFLIGKRYYEYARRNSYRLRNNTAVTTDSLPAPNVPLADWNLTQLVAAAEQHLYRSLEISRSARTKLSDIPAIVTNTISRVAERPTLYDLLAREALDMLGNPLLSVGDADVSQPEQYLTDAAAFVAMPLPMDEESGVYRKLRIYQQLLNFHLGPPNQALLAVDQERIAYVSQIGVSAKTHAAALRRMQSTYAGVPGAQSLLIYEAQLYVYGGEELGDKPKATALALLNRVTDTSIVVATPAEQLRRQILAKELVTAVDNAYPTGGNLLLNLRYRNIDRVYYRLYPAPAEGPDKKLTRWDADSKALAALLRQQPTAQADFKLLANDDYESHTTETWLPTPSSGRYYLLTSDNPNFDQEKGLFSITNFQVTNLAVQRLDLGDRYVFEVIDRTTGAPRTGLTVQVQENDNRGNWNTVQKAVTDRQGRISPQQANRRSIRLIVSDPQNRDQLYTSQTYFNYYRNQGMESRDQTLVFTDRHIYRPGQKVNVYGLTWRILSDQMPQPLSTQKRTLELLDANWQVVEKVEVTSDEFSRFNTSFRLPTGGLTGSFQIRTEGGSIQFQVEEYKRPRFTVELKAHDFVMADEEAIVTGSAKLFAGPAVNDAKVNYRIFLEEVSYWWWRGGGNDRELVADGTTTTDGSGTFEVKLTPENRSTKGRKRYKYVIEADVTDDTGETHDASTSVALRSDKPVVGLSTPVDLIDVTDSLTILAAGTDEDLEVKVTITPVNKPGVGFLSHPQGFPDRPLLTEAEYQQLFPGLPAVKTPEAEAWPTTGAARYTGQLTLTKGEGRLQLPLTKWPVGHYRIDWTYPDGTAGEPTTFAVLDTEQALLPPGQLAHLAISNKKPKVGETVTATLITAVDVPNVDGIWSSRRGDKTIAGAANRRERFAYTFTEADRGGVYLNLSFPRFGKIEYFSQAFQLDWDNKRLKIDYKTFRDNLRPGTPERWELTVSNADGAPVMAGAVAAMYDASLDDIAPNNGWAFQPYPSHYSRFQRADLLTEGQSQGYGRTDLRAEPLPTPLMLPRLDLVANVYPVPVAYRSAMRSRKMDTEADEVMLEESVQMTAAAPSGAPPPPPPPPAPKVEEIFGNATDADDSAPEPVKIRKKLQETALWRPDLRSDANGNLVVSFDSPEALTRWKFRLFAHDKELATAVSEQTIVTQKELMVLPNVPRFVREGDKIQLTARVNNLTDKAMSVTTSLELFDPTTDELFTATHLKSLGAAAGAKEWMKEQTVAPQSGESVSFKLSIPDGYSEQGPIGYRVIARAAGFSDGEENAIPVLTDRTLVTVSQPFYLKEGEKKEVSLPLLSANNSPTMRPVNYTFQAVTNPAWMALKALPYLMEYPYDCTEQLANRYFANQLAFATVSRKPVLEQVFREWQKDSNALKSELEQNANLKNALLTETPWVRAAQDESAQRARIGELFDLKRLADEQTAALDKLVQRQTDQGYFPWFPGGYENRYITQYVLETMGRMKQLGVITPDQTQKTDIIAEKAYRYLDGEYDQEYKELVRRMERDKKDPNWRDSYRPSSRVVHYLYARTMAVGRAGAYIPGYFTDEGGFNFYLSRVMANWLDYGLYEQALIAATSARIATLNKNSPVKYGEIELTEVNGKSTGSYAQLIIESLRERALRKDEFGMFWKYDRGYRWQNLPIETHCRILEAFQVAGGTTEELDEMRLWLLTNKRTSRWSTTKSTAAAVFALLNTGTNWADGAGQPIKVTYPGGGRTGTRFASRVRAAQKSPEAATGAFEVSALGADIDNRLGVVKVSNPDNRLVWGGVFYQYTEVAAKVQASNDGPLTLSRQLYRRIATEDGIRLEPITDQDPLAPGDRVTVKLTVKSDRDLDFVHLKDRRAATFEPIEQLSGYRYEGGVGYYFAPGDLATNFFIDRLPRGTFVLEYDLFATYAGSFSNGLGRVQCMYAPEFGGNTEGARVEVRSR